MNTPVILSVAERSIFAAFPINKDLSSRVEMTTQGKCR